MKKAFITGIGIVSSLGKNFEEHQKNLLKLTSGIKKVQFTNDDKKIESFVGKVTKNLDLPVSYQHVYNNLRFSLSAVKEAINCSKVDLSHKRIAITLGTSLGGKTIGQKGLYRYEKGDYTQNVIDLRRQYLQNIADEILAFLDIHAATFIISTACSASNNAAILGAQLIQSDSYDVVIAGGSDELTDISLAGFSSLGAINKKCPAQPYSKGAGISIGEGAGFIILENEEHLLKRHVFAEFIGGTISSDCYHITAPDPKGSGAERVINNSLDQAHLSVSDIDYINGHGTGTHANDAMEKKLLGNKFSNKTIASSTKCLTGHTLGAAGIIELINTIAMMNISKVVGTLNSVPADKKDHLNTEGALFLKNQVVDKNIDYAINLSFAFGGNNSCSIISKYNVHKGGIKQYSQLHQFRIIGYEATLLANGELISPVDSPSYVEKRPKGTNALGFAYNDFKLKEKISPTQYRRFDDFAKMAVRSVARALENSGIDYKKYSSEKVALIFSTPGGPIKTVEEIEKSIPHVGYENISAAAFPFTVLNAAAGVISQSFKIKGPLSVISANGTGFIDAFEYADMFARNYDLDYIIMVNANQVSDYNLFSIERLGASKTFNNSDFVSTFILKKTQIAHLPRVLNAMQLKGSHLTSSDLEKMIHNLLEKANVSGDKIKGIFWNRNRSSTCPEYHSIKIFAREFAQFDLAHLHFTTEGAGEELVELLGEHIEKGLYIVIAYSLFGGYSALLVEK